MYQNTYTYGSKALHRQTRRPVDPAAETGELPAIATSHARCVCNVLARLRLRWCGGRRHRGRLLVTRNRAGLTGSLSTGLCGICALSVAGHLERRLLVRIYVRIEPLQLGVQFGNVLGCLVPIRGLCLALCPLGPLHRPQLNFRVQWRCLQVGRAWRELSRAFLVCQRGKVGEVGLQSAHAPGRRVSCDFNLQTVSRNTYCR